jgi:O-antigen/teichoic acid export membrane protein
VNASPVRNHCSTKAEPPPAQALQHNILANYVGQAYAAGISIVMLPVYLRCLGAEAYGLVGFFAMLQVWFQLLDVGLTPTLSRELSRFRAGALDGAPAAAMVRTLEWLFGGMAVICALIVGLAANWVARDWLKAQQLPPEELRSSVICMGGMIGLRLWTGLYRSGLAGLERMVALNVATVVLATLRSVGVVAVFFWWSTRPSSFFGYQLAVAVVEVIVTGAVFYRAFPVGAAPICPSLGSLRAIFGLAGSMAFLATAWVVISQTDKLVLSWVLELKAYGCFMVAATLAGAISMLAAPINQALQPRFVILAAQRRDEELTMLYRTSTQITGAIVLAVSGVMACFAEPLLRAWTGNAEVARQGAPMLPLYALGNGVVALLSLAFLMQFAYGKVRWHVIGNCLFGGIWIPGAYLAASKVGAVGTGWVWLLGNLAFLVLWLPYVHWKLFPTLWWRWLVCDIGLIVLAEIAVLALVSRIDVATYGRLGVFAVLALVTATVTLAGLLAGAGSRPALFRVSRSLFAVKPA